MIRGDIVSGIADGDLHSTNGSASQDTCILMRSIAISLHDPYHPYLDTYDRIMRRYERECSDRLLYLPKPSYWESVPLCVNRHHRDALKELYDDKNNIGDSAKLDYYLGSFEWRTMFPEAILREHGINVQESKSNV